MDSYGLAAWSSRTGRLNAIPLVMFLAGAAACLLVREIRQHRGYRLLLIWTAIVLVFLTEFEGLKTHFYLIYLTPLYSILLAVAVRWIWLKRAALAMGASRRDAPVCRIAGAPHTEFRVAQPEAVDLQSGGRIPARAIRSKSRRSWETPH